MKYGWIAGAVVAMSATLLSTGQVAAQEWGQEAAEEPYRPPTTVPSEVQRVEDVEAEQLKADETPKVRGFVPPGESPEGGMGTQAAERERSFRGVATVGESVRGTGRPEEEAIPLRFQFHGYYRARYNWIGNAPIGSGQNQDAFASRNASFGTMRLRLDPEVSYGPNPDLPIARLRFTIDGFDNVVWGDNARVQQGIPLFATEQSITNIDGFDLKESLKLERAWIEFLVPIGQIRVGRMESQWGMGQLTHAGNGLAEWGDFYRGETFDRILFATRPITLVRGITKNDTRQTPLIYAFVYDRLSQDPVVDPVINSPFDGGDAGGSAAINPNFKPTYTTFPERSTFPLAYLTNLDRRVNEIVNVLAWSDEEFGNGATDELFAGAYVVYRWQRSTESRIVIPDVAWRLKYTLRDNRKLALYSEGEWHSIFGHSGALAFSGGCPPEPCNRGEAGIHNVMARFGIGSPGKWGTYLEGGWSSGDDDLLSIFEGENKKLKTRGFNQNIKVGLLMYQVALRALTWNALSAASAEVLGANGSVWNSVYLLPVGRVTIVPGLEFHAQFLVAWASALDPLIYGANANKVKNCRFKSECFYGWEADLALRAKIGARDIIWVDLEGGLMQPGQAFTNAGFNDAFLWTTQLRAAMIF